MYAVSLPLQLLTTTGVLTQGSTALVVLTAIHAGVVTALFWSLVANAVVATQIVEDGTWSSLIVCVFFKKDWGVMWHSCFFFLSMQPYYVFALLIFGLTTYLSLDVALGVTQTIGAPSNPVDSLHSISLFVLLNMWPPLYVPHVSPTVVKIIGSSQNRDNLLRPHDAHRPPGAQ